MVALSGSAFIGATVISPHGHVHAFEINDKF
jgi:hypothetical protein